MKKTTIILVILLLICVYLIFKKEKPEVITKIKTTIEYVTDTIDNTKPTEIKKVYIKVPVETIINDTITKIVYKDKEVNEYKYIDSLSNGVVKSTILADNIYKRDIELETFNKTTEINTTKTVFKSSFYVGGTMTLNNNYNALNPTLGIYYNSKSKFLVGAGLGFSENDFNINVTFALKI